MHGDRIVVHRVTPRLVMLPYASEVAGRKIHANIFCANDSDQTYDILEFSPRQIAAIVAVVSEKMSEAWRLDHHSQLHLVWYRTAIVEYYVGTAYGLSQKMGSIIACSHIHPEDIALWLLRIRRPSQEEFEDYYNNDL